MAAVSCPGTADVIVLSDSDGGGPEDSSRSGAPKHGAPKHVAPSSGEWVRRSTRHRRASTRFSPDDEAPVRAPSPVKKSGAGLPLCPPPSTKRRRSSSLNSNSSTSCYGIELVDPQVLITYVEKLKRKIQHGKFGINMPVGPGEFVLVDAVDYLRNLGYSNFEEKDGEEEQSDDEEDGGEGKEQEGGEDEEEEGGGEDEEEEGGEEDEEEEEKNKTAFTDIKRFKEEIVFEPQAALKIEDKDVNDGSNESDEQLKPEVNFWDKGLEALFTSSLSQNPDSSDVVSNRSTEDSIDVEALDAAAFDLRPSAIKVKRPSKSIRYATNRFNDDDGSGTERRHTHNIMEQARRREMANLFTQLSTLVNSTDGSKFAKVKVLSGAVDLIAQLKKDQIRLAADEKSLKHTNQGLMQVRENLCKMVKAKEEATKRQKSTRVKKSVKGRW